MSEQESNEQESEIRFGTIVKVKGQESTMVILDVGEPGSFGQSFLMESEEGKKYINGL